MHEYCHLGPFPIVNDSKKCPLKCAVLSVNEIMAEQKPLPLLLIHYNRPCSKKRMAPA